VPTLVPFVVGGAVAIVIAAIELYKRLQSRPTLRGGALRWWLGRLGLEFGVGLLAIAAWLAVGGEQATSPLTWVMIGAVGPAVARSRFVTFRQGTAEQSYGISTIYEPLRDFFEARIDDIGAVEQDQWITNEILPRLKARKIRAPALVKRLEGYIASLPRLTDVQKLNAIATLQAGLADSSLNPSDRMRFLVSTVCKPPLLGYRMIDRLAKSG
jgi:hypothetical protein